MKPRELLDNAVAYGGCALTLFAVVVALGAAFALGMRLTDILLYVVG